jgi:hypothetical protein
MPDTRQFVSISSPALPAFVVADDAARRCATLFDRLVTGQVVRINPLFRTPACGHSGTTPVLDRIDVSTHVLPRRGWPCRRKIEISRAPVTFSR